MVLDPGRGPRTEVLEVRGLNVFFESAVGRLHAVSDLSFSVGAGEMVGLVGESGSGKSVTALALNGLLPQYSSHVTGEVLLNGRDVLGMDDKARAATRGREIGMIFQEPMTALDPVFTVGAQLGETLRTHEKLDRRSARRRAVELLDMVGIPDPARRVDAYPHQLSGGMRQRVMIAIALAAGPSLLVADEPTTALDVTIQAQILDVLRDLSRDRGTAVLLITHDLGVVAETCSRVLTMYAGQLVESGTVEDALVRPAHPYTSGLIGSIPTTALRKAVLPTIPGRVPPLSAMPSGCRFGPRCSHAAEGCDAPQALRPLGGDQSRHVRCHLAEGLRLSGAHVGEGV
jgi:peptide/nickel transport system ATP-binding protein